MIRISNSEKRERIQTVLEDPVWSGRSSRWIASAFGVSSTFVNNLRTRPKTYVLYAVRCHQFVKFGISIDASRRLKSLQTSCPFKMTVEKTWSLYANLRYFEALVHKELRPFHHRNEWYFINDEMYSIVDTVVKGFVVKP